MKKKINEQITETIKKFINDFDLLLDDRISIFPKTKGIYLAYLNEL